MHEQGEHILSLRKEKEKLDQFLEKQLDSMAKVVRWGVLGKEREENKEVLQELWLEALESIILGFWLSINCEMRTLDNWDLLMIVLGYCIQP